MSEETPVKSLAEVQQRTQIQPAGAALDALSPFSSIAAFENAQRMAKVLCQSMLVPKTYQGPNAIGDCVIALGMANRMGADPIMVMQNLYVVHGRPAWSGQFVIAAINQSGRFAEPLHFIEVGKEGQDDWGFYAETTAKGTGNKVKGPTITIKLAKAEGWYQKNPKWVNMPEMMLRYRAGSWFGRTECPEILMGFQSAEEIQDVIDIDPSTGEVLNVEPDATTVVPIATAAEPVKPTKAVELEPVTLEGGKDVASSIKTDDPEAGLIQVGAVDPEVTANRHGEKWNPEIHATSSETGGGILLKNGHWKARRGYKAPEPETKPDAGSANPPPAEEKKPVYAKPEGEEEPPPPESGEAGSFDAWAEGLE